MKLSLILLGFVLAQGHVNARTIEVRSARDSEPGQYHSDSRMTLREAIEESKDGDEIVFNLSRSDETDTYLLHEVIIPAGTTKSVDLKNTILEVAPYKNIRYFRIDENAILKLKNGTIIGGNIAGHPQTKGGASGGGIYIQPGGALSFENITIKNCKADNGGAIYAETGTSMLLNRCAVINSGAAVNGGGIYARGNMDLDNTTVACNRASNGGGIYCDQAQAQVTNCTISLNAASGTDCAADYFMYLGKLALGNSIIASASAQQGEARFKNSGGEISDIGNNIIQMPSGYSWNSRLNWVDQDGSGSFTREGTGSGPLALDNSLTETEGAVPVVKINSVASVANSIIPPDSDLFNKALRMNNPDGSGIPGSSIAVLNNLALIGIPDSNIVYSFLRNGNAWFNTQKLATPYVGDVPSKFGCSVALSGSSALIESENTGFDEPYAWPQKGIGYVYSYDPAKALWSCTDKIGSNHDPSTATNLNYTGVIDDDNTAIAWDDVDGISDGLETDYPVIDGSLGHPMAVSGSSLFIGAPCENNFNGAVYVFAKDSQGYYSQTQKLVPPDNLIKSRFGYSVAVSGNRAVIGCPYAGNQNGCVLLYAFNGTSWELEKRIDGPARKSFVMGVRFWSDGSDPIIDLNGNGVWDTGTGAGLSEDNPLKITINGGPEINNICVTINNKNGFEDVRK